MKKIVITILILILVPVSLQLIGKSIPSRHVASENSDPNIFVEDTLDLSESTPEEFVKAFKYQILKEPTVIQTRMGPGIRLGHFLLKGSGEKAVSVCEQYPTMDIIFAADGIANSGEIPQMIVRGPCLPEAERKHIEALPVPFQEFLSQPISQKAFKFSLSNTSDTVSLFFNHVFDFWPTEWTWVGIRLYGKNPNQILKIDGYEILSVTGEPLILSPQSTE